MLSSKRKPANYDSANACQVNHSARFVAAVIAQLAQPFAHEEKSTFSEEIAELPTLRKSIIDETTPGNHGFRVSQLATAKTSQTRPSIATGLGR